MKAVVIEDEILIREGLCKLMKKMFPEIEVTGTACNGQEGLLCIERDKPGYDYYRYQDAVLEGLKITKMQESGIFPKDNCFDSLFGIFLRPAGCETGGKRLYH